MVYLVAFGGSFKDNIFTVTLWAAWSVPGPKSAPTCIERQHGLRLRVWLRVEIIDVCMCTCSVCVCLRGGLADLAAAGSGRGAFGIVLFGRTCLAAHVEAVAMAGVVRDSEAFDFGGCQRHRYVRACAWDDACRCRLRLTPAGVGEVCRWRIMSVEASLTGPRRLPRARGQDYRDYRSAITRGSAHTCAGSRLGELGLIRFRLSLSTSAANAFALLLVNFLFM